MARWLRVWMLSVLVMGAIGGALTPAAAQDGPPGAETLALLETTIVPQRDLVDLARRLKGVTDIPTPPASAPPLQVGDVVSFWAENLSEDYAFQLEAELAYATPHVYMFVEVGQDVDVEALAASAERFESRILPKIHEVFGWEWYPGIDGDPHLYVLHATRLGNWVAGYYDSTSEYPQAVSEHSNQHEMFFINLDTIGYAVGTAYYESVLAHEFQHMVHWTVDLNEDSWLNEGLSELATLITGYGPSDFTSSFLEAPDIQLNTWPEDDYLRGPHYGSGFLFVAYLYERYGEEATTTLVQEAANGMESVQATLGAIGATDPGSGAPVSAEDLFADWLATNLLMDTSIGDGRYGYTLPDMAGLPHAALTHTLSVGVPLEAAAPQWGAHYIQIGGGAQAQTLRLRFQGQPTVSIVPAQAHSGRFMMWSNRADESDPRLTRALDLRGVSRATLNYWLWYHIEDLWDYGYVMVSTDGGATWTPLRTARTTDENPHNNAYGPGYTGTSDGWVQESVDLTPYAGQEVLIRFEYITDAAVTQPGMLIDDVSVPEIGYAEDFEQGAEGWVSEGWLRMDNVLPQRFNVQLVQTANAEAPVTRLLSGADAPEGEWTLTVGGQYGDAVLVVSGLAPVTTEPAQYTVTLEKQ